MNKKIILLLMVGVLVVGVSRPMVAQRGYRKEPVIKVEKKYVDAKPIRKKRVRKRPVRIPVFMVDDFSDGNFRRNPEWWYFGDLNLSIVRNAKSRDFKYLGSRSLRVQGRTNQWYVGGFGAFLGIDTFDYTTLKLVLYSPWRGAGMIRVELYDDDNNNWVVDMDRNRIMPSADDVFAYNVMLDWEGWRVVSIPLNAFRDVNPRVGDNIWNPYQFRGSGGLLQMQVIGFTPKDPNGRIDFRLDTVKFVKM